MTQTLEHRYAGFWIRTLAVIIDSLICMIPALIFQIFVPFFGGILVTFMYRPFFESSALMATPGKALLGLRVTNSQLNRIGFGTALFRMLMSYVSALLLGLGYLMALFTERKQTLHDFCAGTIVTYGPHSTQNYLEAWTDQVESVFTSGFSKESKTASTATESQTQETSQPLESSQPEDQTDVSLREHPDLVRLQQLLQQELITSEEYENLKSQYLKKQSHS